MKNTLTLFALLFAASSFAQHYYNDILDAQAMAGKMKQYMDNKVKSVTATGYDARGIKTTDFNEWQEIYPETRTLKIITRRGQEVNRQYYRFDDQFRLIQIIDSSGDISSNTHYHYGSSGRLDSIITMTHDTLQVFDEKEKHHYLYDNRGLPTRLWRIMNGKDSSEYRFALEDNRNVTEENLYRREVGLDPVYYYYDEKNRLTDIVRYNRNLKKLIPSHMFEFDESGRMIQKMTTLSINNPDYLLWRYVYNEKSLKTKEALFNRQKQLTGRIDYAYTFY